MKVIDVSGLITRDDRAPKVLLLVVMDYGLVTHMFLQQITGIYSD